MKYEIRHKETGELLPSTNRFPYKFFANWIWNFAKNCGVPDVYEVVPVKIKK